MPNRINGRPDFADHDFGVTKLKRFPPYVYSKLGGMLVHRVASVDARWWVPGGWGQYLVRLDSPALTINAVCGATFYAGSNGRTGRAQQCALPAADAVACGRCNGTAAIFGRGGREIFVKRADARRRLGCAVEVD